MINPMMGSHPVVMLMNAVRSGGNPMLLLQQMAGQNPQAAQLMNLMRGKNPRQLRTMAENMAQERGISINDIARQLGIATPSDR